MRRNLVTILEMEGYQPIAAENGQQGLEAARREKPDLVLCDVMMPEMDGHAVLTALRSEAGSSMTPFIFLTAKGERMDVRAGMNLGADDYLIKPVRREDLLAAMAARLERAEAQAAQARGFSPDFSSPAPLEKLGLTPREAEVLLWVAQGKGNAEIGIILSMAEATVKRHLTNLFEKLGVESRNAATFSALEVLSMTVKSQPESRRPQYHQSTATSTPPA
jgi:DNA-binding NarL/FixJ family response regulator